jgi:acyl-CoA synthetase (NDP forming)
LSEVPGAQPRADLGPLLAPRSIAVVGVSRTDGTPSRHLLANLCSYRFPGPLLLVNRSGQPIDGLASFQSVRALPEAVDLALVLVPSAEVPATVVACAERGVKAAVVYSAGFADDRGPEGGALQKELEDVIASTGMVLCGPNSEGFFNAVEGVPATFSAAVSLDDFGGREAPEAGNIGVVAQSGGLGFSLLKQGLDRELRFSYVISAGNEASLTVMDYLEFLLDDDGTDVLLAYVEGLRDPERLGGVAARAAELGKPIVMAKVGRSDAGRRAALSHTGHLAGEDAAYAAVFRRYGIVRAHDTEEMLDVAMALSWRRRRPGSRVAIVSYSGGSAVWMADACSTAGLVVPPLDVAVQDRLRAVLPSFAATTNPVDITGASKMGPAEVLTMVADDPGVDSLVLIAPLRNPTLLESERPALERLSHQLTRPVVLYGYTDPTADNRTVLRRLRLPFYPSPVRAARSLAALVAAPGRDDDGPPDPAPLRAAAADVVERLRRAPPVLCEYEVTALLAMLGLDAPAGQLAATAEEASRAALDIGYPVALKVQSPDVAHKLAAGGVALGLSSAAEVEAAFARIVEQTARDRPAAVIRGVLVQEMVPVGLELIVGIDDSSGLGPMILVGLGGSLAEVLDRTVTYPAPFGAGTATGLLEEVGAGRALRHAGGDSRLHGAAELLSRLSVLAAAGAGVIRELDLNPVVVDYRTGRARIVDALAVTAGDGAPAP